MCLFAIYLLSTGKSPISLKARVNKVKCIENQTSVIIYKYEYYHSTESILNSTTPTSVST